MSKPKHTPGPWQVTPDFVRIQTGENVADFQIADCADSVFAPSHDECEANAQRIVDCVNACEGINPKAVPDLVWAIETAMAEFKEKRKGPTSHAFHVCKAALRLARGEE